MRPILSVNDLAHRLGTSVEGLRKLARNAERDYKPQIYFDKKNPAIKRDLWVPNPELKEIQRRIHRNLLAPIALQPGVHGGVRGRSTGRNAQDHVGRNCVVTIDVRKFFPKVRHYIVYNMLQRELGWGREVAHLVTCVFRAKPVHDSAACRSTIPRQAGPAFRGMSVQ